MVRQLIRTAESSCRNRWVWKQISIVEVGDESEDNNQKRLRPGDRPERIVQVCAGTNCTKEEWTMSVKTTIKAGCGPEIDPNGRT